ncbi:AMP-binding protein [Ascidiimonas aurantiaca]|uniref:AMP-binding protein n=1 Tax=Ascidiimonas aurantiaca TaxID=1685432 RepID=UPI0030EDC2D1
MKTIIESLKVHAAESPLKAAFLFLENGEHVKEQWSYQTLFEKVKQLGTLLRKTGSRHERALLLFEDVKHFIPAFLACQYADITAVPVFFNKGSRQRTKMQLLAKDAKASLILTSSSVEPAVLKIFDEILIKNEIHVLSVDKTSSWPRDYPGPSSSTISISSHLAFIQYTSGSTGTPKGVEVSKENLMHNQFLIRNAFGVTRESVILSWLPFHHDMGLIGNILHCIYCGCSCILMSPFHFMQKPSRWLKAIAHFKVTHSGGPNFAYDLCVDKTTISEARQLDLSGWKVAYNGSEPVREETLRRFSSHFESAGFAKEAFYPCYGLAEATLLVSGVKDPLDRPITYQKQDERSKSGAKLLVGSGKVAKGMEVIIVSPGENKICKELQEGEICIYGDSVTRGYWGKENNKEFLTVNGKRYLRSGDLGFFHKDQLFVSGRIKEMLIIRGRNYYPYDIEESISVNLPEIETHGVAVFNTGIDDTKFVIAAELKRGAVRNRDHRQTLTHIEKLVSSEFGLIPHDVILTTPLKIPRTTSGKLQRVKCKILYEEGQLPNIASKQKSDDTKESFVPNIQKIQPGANPKEIEAYIISLIESKTRQQLTISPGYDPELTELGIDSVRAVELINYLNSDLEMNLDASTLFEAHTLGGFSRLLENMLWLKNNQSSENEIII